MNKNLIIFGASGHGRFIAEIALLNGYKKIVFADDAWPSKKDIGGFKVESNILDATKNRSKNHSYFIAIGDNHIRKELFNALTEQDLHVAKIIHPSAIVSDSSEINAGSVVMPGAVINSNVMIGKGCIINSNATIEHDCVIGDFSHISPNASLAGSVIIGQKTWVGINSCIINDIKIGNSVIIGAGSVVIRNIDDNQKVAGNPVTVLKG